MLEAQSLKLIDEKCERRQGQRPLVTISLPYGNRSELIYLSMSKVIRVPSLVMVCYLCTCQDRFKLSCA